MNRKHAFSCGFSSLVLLIVFALCLTGCSNDSHSDPEKAVYYGGVVDDGTREIAKVWKNGSEIFAEATATKSSIPALEVKDGHWYAVESIYDDPLAPVMKLFRDGSLLYTVANSPFDITAIAFSGTDIYLGGVVADGSNRKIAIWKNNVLQYSFSSSVSSEVVSLDIEDGHIYTACVVRVDSKNYGKVFMDNGTEVFTTDGSSDFARIAGAEKDGADLYVAGYDGNLAHIWKNGTITHSSDSTLTGTENVSANCMEEEGGVVYMGGFLTHNTKKVAIVWKNDTEMFMGDAATEGDVHDLDISDGKIYSAGYNTESGVSRAVVWCDGAKLYSISDGSSSFILRITVD